MIAGWRAEMGAPVLLPVVKLGYRREDAAAFIGVSVTKFTSMVKEGRMPQPCRLDGCVIWRADDLIEAFNRLTGRDTGRLHVEEDTWSDV